MPASRAFHFKPGSSEQILVIINLIQKGILHLKLSLLIDPFNRWYPIAEIEGADIAAIQTGLHCYLSPAAFSDQTDFFPFDQPAFPSVSEYHIPHFPV